MIKKISGTQCETLYEINGQKVLLWAIVGGTLALGINGYRITERFNYSEAHDSYKHNYLRWVPPTYHDLTNGEQTILDFTEKAVKILELRDERLAVINSVMRTGEKTVSKTFRNSEKERVIAKWELGENYCAPVTGEIISYRCRNAHGFGRCDEEISQVADKNWLAFQRFVNAKFSENDSSWENFSSDEFDTFIGLLKKII